MTDSTAEHREKRPDKPQFLDITLEEAREMNMEEIRARRAKGHIITLMWHGRAAPVELVHALGMDPVLFKQA